MSPKIPSKVEKKWLHCIYAKSANLFGSVLKLTHLGHFFVLKKSELVEKKTLYKSDLFNFCLSCQIISKDNIPQIFVIITRTYNENIDVYIIVYLLYTCLFYSVIQTQQ